MVCRPLMKDRQPACTGPPWQLGPHLRKEKHIGRRPGPPRRRSHSPLVVVECLEQRTLLAGDLADGMVQDGMVQPEAVLEGYAMPAGPLVDRAAAARNVIRVTGEQHDQLRISDPGDDTLIDLRGATFYGLEDARWLEGQPTPARWPTQPEFNSIPETSIPERYPVTVLGTSKRVSVIGGQVIGKLNHLAPWHVWKLHADGDGFHIEGVDSYEISGMFVDNFEDGFAPRGAQSATFSIHDVYGRNIHDDAIENDGIHSGIIRDSYFQTQTFYSARGGSNASAAVTIDNCVVHLDLQPHQGGTGGPDDINSAGGYPYADGLGGGSIFKMDWGTSDSGVVHVKNSVFLLERPATSSFVGMQFAPGTYENVTIVWLGAGAYPWPAPPGVTITRDRTVFDRAKAAFFAAHLQFHDLDPSDGHQALTPWCNPAIQEDVNGDGAVGPLDALIVINDLNRAGSRPLSAPSGPTAFPFFDVSADNYFSPLDALEIINHLNASASRAVTSARLDAALGPAAALPRLESAAGLVGFGAAAVRTECGDALSVARVSAPVAQRPFEQSLAPSVGPTTLKAMEPAGQDEVPDADGTLDSFAAELDTILSELWRSAGAARAQPRD